MTEGLCPMVEMVKSMRANPGISGVIWLRYGASDVTGNSKKLWSGSENATSAPRVRPVGRSLQV